jgi:hypothetical protein
MRLKTFAKRAGAVVLALLVIDLVATAATVAVGAVLLKK